MSLLLSHLFAILIGIAIGAGGHYFGSKYTDRRHEKEYTSKLKEEFQTVKDRMPKLIEIIKQALVEDKMIREIVILQNRRIIFNSDINRIAFYEQEIQSLQAKIGILQDKGYIVDITPGNTPIYRCREEFIDFIMKS